MKNLSISKKLIVGFGALLCIILFTIGVAFYSISILGGRTQSYVALAICGTVAVVLTILLVILIRRAILSPINEIMRAYDQISKGNIKTTINYDSRDELGRMVALIQKSNALQNTLVEDIVEKLQMISRGELNFQVDLDYPGDFSIMKQTIEAAVFNLNDTMKNINIAAEQVATGSDQVSSGAQALTAGSTEQAASISELASSVEKVAAQAEKTPLPPWLHQKQFSSPTKASSPEMSICSS